MLDWIASVCGISEADTAEELVSAIDALPPQAWVLQGTHRGWSRKVEGFAAMSALLLVINATSIRHMWVVSMHRPSWEFFASSGSLVDVGVFRTVISLAPLTTDQLRELTIGRTERAGFEADFSQLVRSSPLGGDPVLERERSIQLFYRLLLEASGGNPTTAVHLWTTCLETTDRDGVLAVYVHEALRGGVLSNLQDTALFLLVALRIQDEVSEVELEQVTNLPRNVVRANVRLLISKGLVQHEGAVLRIPDSRIPAVTRTLRRRHFLHLGA